MQKAQTLFLTGNHLTSMLPNCVFYLPLLPKLKSIMADTPVILQPLLVNKLPNLVEITNFIIRYDMDMQKLQSLTALTLVLGGYMIPEKLHTLTKLNYLKIVDKWHIVDVEFVNSLYILASTLPCLENLVFESYTAWCASNLFYRKLVCTPNPKFTLTFVTPRN